MNSIIRRVKIICFSPFLLMSIFFVRILKPIILIRFRYADVASIGHFAAETDIYLSSRAWKVEYPKKTFDIFYFTNDYSGNYYISNKYLLKLVKKKMFFFNPLNFTSYLHYFNRLIPGYEAHECFWPGANAIDKLGYVHKSPPQIIIPKKDVCKGEEILKEIVRDNDNEFVCFANRDSSYMKYAYSSVDCSYHNYRDSEISNYMLAANYLTEKNITCIRMGKVTEKKLETNNYKIIDYANSSFRSCFMDVYLLSKSTFVLSALTGVVAIPLMFRKPMVFVNVSSMLSFFDEKLEHYDPIIVNSLFIFKKHFSKAENRFLTIREIMQANSHRFNKTEQYERAGIELIENTPEEIKDVAIEMYLKLKGEWEDTNEDLILQKRFWNCIGKKRLGLCSVGSAFLRANEWMLA